MAEQSVASRAPKRARKLKRAATAPTTDDAIELALEAQATGRAPEGPALDLIRNQNRLVGWQIATERAAFALKLLTAVIGIVVAVVVATVLISASQYRGLTLQPFSVPPELEARGLNGSAVATRLLDKLTALQTGTVSLRAPNSYANSWGDTVEVEIPQVGVSAGELWKFLRAWLGEEVKITGEIVRTGDGLQITARAGGQAAAPIVGDEAELEALLDQAAEAIFAETQPYRYAVYLSRVDRIPEAMAAYERLASRGDDLERKWALAGWSLQLQYAGDYEGAILRAEQALEIDPEFGLAHANLSGVLWNSGRVEESHRHGLLAAQYMPRNRDLNPALAKGFAREMEAITLGERHDHAAAAALYAEAAAIDAAAERASGLSRAQQLAALYDIAGARRIAAAAVAEAGQREQVESYICRALEDWTCVVRGRTLMEQGALSQGVSEAALRRYIATQVSPIMATAMARTGDVEGARAEVAGTPADIYLAVIARGVVAARSGDVQGSERLFTRAAALAPSLADAELEWGRERLARGDAAGAVVPLREATRKAPRWADPLKYWGDAMAARGDHRGALGRYAAAAERAPRWGALHLAWGRTPEAAGRRDEARAKYRAAAGMGLSPADRAEVTRRLGTR